MAGSIASLDLLFSSPSAFTIATSNFRRHNRQSSPLLIMLVTIRHLPRRLTASPTIIRGVASSAASFPRLPSPSSSSELLSGNDIQATTWRPTFIVESSPSPSLSPPATSISSWRAFSSSSSSTSSSSLRESYNHILVERRFPEESSSERGGVGIITLHRPKALNALCDALFDDLIHAVKAFDDDDTIGCIVVTGSGKAFAAGEYLQHKM